MNNTTSITCFTNSNFIDFWIFSKKLRITISFENNYYNYYNYNTINLFEINQSDEECCENSKDIKSPKEIIFYLK